MIIRFAASVGIHARALGIRGLGVVIGRAAWRGEPADSRCSRTTGGYRRNRTSAPPLPGGRLSADPAAIPQWQIGWVPPPWRIAGSPSDGCPCDCAWETVLPGRCSRKHSFLDPRVASLREPGAAPLARRQTAAPAPMVVPSTRHLPVIE